MIISKDWPPRRRQSKWSLTLWTDGPSLRLPRYVSPGATVCRIIKGTACKIQNIEKDIFNKDIKRNDDCRMIDEARLT